MTDGLDWRTPLPSGFRWPNGVRAAACFTFDVDAEAVMLADAPGSERHLDVMSHQEYGPRTAVPRILRLLDRLRVRATFFVPGYTAERWPAVVRAIRDAGHEIAHHGFMHESSRDVTAEVEEARLVRGLEAFDRVVGVRPVGYRSPNWQTSYALPGLLAKHGFRYASNLMDSDWPYRLATSPEADAPTLVELPIHWSLDDWGRYNYLPGLTGSGVIESPAAVVEMWRLELEALVDESGLFVLTSHPFVTGRASRAAALGRLIEQAQSIDGLWIATCGEIAEWVEKLPLEPVAHTPPMPEHVPPLD
ncbi:MAG: polysaccharide deacetylase family protein [Chloroflexota bacterium]